MRGSENRRIWRLMNKIDEQQLRLPGDILNR
jgi:hypothetical protein